MKIDPKTIQVLKNFSTINPSLICKPGSSLETISPAKTVMGMATVPDTFPIKFAIYNLSQFIGCVSMFQNPDLEFGNQAVLITDSNKRFTYYYADPSVIVGPPEKKLVMPSPDASFTLLNKDLQEVLKALGILGLPEIAFVGDGDTVSVEAVDSKASSSNRYAVTVGKTAATFRAIFKAENIKIMPSDYQVEISSHGLAKFTGDPCAYFVAIEQTSSFGG